jgi:hypothetical protein
VKRRALFLCTIAIIVLAPAVALARRHPNTGERAAIAKRMQIPGECAVIWISTVDRNWASFTTSHKQSCIAHAANGIAVLHHRHGRWHLAFEGSDIPCPVPHVPARVAKDLHVHCNVRR